MVAFLQIFSQTFTEETLCGLTATIVTHCLQNVMSEPSWNPAGEPLVAQTLALLTI